MCAHPNKKKRKNRAQNLNEKSRKSVNLITLSTRWCHLYRVVFFPLPPSTITTTFQRLHFYAIYMGCLQFRTLSLPLSRAHCLNLSFRIAHHLLLEFCCFSCFRDIRLQYNNFVRLLLNTVCRCCYCIYLCACVGGWVGVCDLSQSRHKLFQYSSFEVYNINMNKSIPTPTRDRKNK